MLDVKKVQEEAQKEIAEEASAKAKERIKEQMRRVHKAQTCLENEKRALDDLLACISEGN